MKTQGKLNGIVLSDDFMHTTSKAQIVKANKQIHTTSRTTSIQKTSVQQTVKSEKASYRMGKKFANHISDHNF